MPKPIREQVLVITGASSGIGRETALEAAKKGASVVLAARNAASLAAVADKATQLGGTAHSVPTDVAHWDQVERLAQEAVTRFGRIDTWINDAGVSEYATVEQMAIDEIERIVQVNILGTMYGVKAVLPIMRAQKSGTIINIGSVLSQRSIALQSVYCATKHAVKGFTEALRLELDREKSGINVTLILPGVINTPFYTQARSRMAVKPKPIPPFYEPTSAAQAILFAAQHPRRELYVGGAAKALTMMEAVSPALVDRMMLLGGAIFRTQQTHEPNGHRPDNLFSPVEGPGSVEGEWPGRRSLYTPLLEMHPNRKRLLLGLGLAGAALLLGRRLSQD